MIDPTFAPYFRAPHPDGLWGVFDSNAIWMDGDGKVMRRTHIARDGSMHHLAGDAPTYVPKETAEGFLRDAAFVVIDEAGHVVRIGGAGERIIYAPPEATAPAPEAAPAPEPESKAEVEATQVPAPPADAERKPTTRRRKPVAPASAAG